MSNVFLYSKVITLIQSRNLVYRVFKFEMYSFVIKIAILVNRDVLLEMVMPALGLNIAKVLELIVDADPNKIL